MAGFGFLLFWFGKNMISYLKRLLIYIYAPLLFIPVSCSSNNSENNIKMTDELKTSDKAVFANHLIDESSPYLLQHAHNPVNWYPWSDEALELAKSEDKPIFLSIGYAACHWMKISYRSRSTASNAPIWIRFIWPPPWLSTVRADGRCRSF